MKNIRFFNETFPENISELQHPDKWPFVGHAVEGPDPYIRYTLNKITGTLSDSMYEDNITENDFDYFDNNSSKLIISYGRVTAEVINAIEQLKEKGIYISIISLNKILQVI